MSEGKAAEARLKLRSDFINRVGVNFLTFGFLTPAALLLEQVTSPSWVVLATSAAFMLAGVALSAWADAILKRLT
ncbi:MAG: hypothetical protein AAF318_17190 [Pseudomonadota bacterium]